MQGHKTVQAFNSNSSISEDNSLLVVSLVCVETWQKCQKGRTAMPHKPTRDMSRVIHGITRKNRKGLRNIGGKNDNKRGHLTRESLLSSLHKQKCLSSPESVTTACPKRMQSNFKKRCIFILLHLDYVTFLPFNIWKNICL